MDSRDGDASNRDARLTARARRGRLIGQDESATESGLMMRRVRGENPRPTGRRTAIVAAALILLAQSLGAAHYHPAPTVQKLSASSAASVDDGLCALCLLHFHAPSAMSPLPSLAVPAAVQHLGLSASRSRRASSLDSHLFGRAPPATV
jgi:hypothetical protein